MKLLAIVLTYNEDRHLDRCLENLKEVTRDIVVVDSFSTDSTQDIARMHGAKLLENKFITQAQQFNWALTQIEPNTDWVLRLDADEFLTPKLISEIRTRLPHMAPHIDGVFFSRRMTFQGRLIKFGGIFPIPILRLFRFGRGKCDNRWMDEKIEVQGSTIKFDGEFIDDNLNSLTWWINKHNLYSSREVVDLLNLEYKFMDPYKPNRFTLSKQLTINHGKKLLYLRLPLGMRALLYFLYRFIFRFGFLDGRSGTAFHFFQGFWYRYLVDRKLAEVQQYIEQHHVTAIVAIDRVLGIEVQHQGEVAINSVIEN